MCHNQECMRQRCTILQQTRFRAQGNESMERSKVSQELERLATFANFPDDDTSSPMTLSKIGFIYTGHGSVIKCPICGLQIERPTRGVNLLAEHRRRSPDCRLAQEAGLVSLSSLSSSFPSQTQLGDSTLAGIYSDIMRRDKRQRYFSDINVGSLPPYFDRENPDFELLRQEGCRLGTFHDWPETALADPFELARAGLFYTGTRDKVRCAFCRNYLHNWVSTDKPMQEHRRHHPACPFVQNLDVANVGLEDQSGIENNARIPPNVGSSSEGASGGGVSASLHSGTQRSAESCMNSTIARAVVEMGFSPENVKNAVQKQLDDTGEFFSSAELLVEKLLFTGASISLGNRPLAHHSSANPSLFAECEPSEQNDSERTIQEAETSHGAVGSHTNHDREEEEEQEVSQKKSRKKARKARKRRNSVATSSQGTAPETHSNKSTDCFTETNEMNAGAIAALPGNEDAALLLDLDEQQLMEENRSLKEARTCKVCMDKEVNTVFLPCGHLICCDLCSPQVRKCPLCRTFIRGTVKTYLS